MSIPRSRGRKIRQRRGDSLKIGAIIGAVAGTAYFLTMMALLGDGDGGEVIVSRAVVGVCCSPGWAQRPE